MQGIRLRSILILILALLAITGCTMPQKAASTMSPTSLTLSGWRLQDITKVQEAGDVISLPDYAMADWVKATVPGTVLTSLVNEGLFPDPLYGENNRPYIIPDSLCRTSYWYRTKFNIAPAIKGRRVWLNFEGINYIADVWINGHQLGTIKGAFARGAFDITPYTTAGESAAVAVLIAPPPHPGNPHEHTVAAGTGRNGGELVQDGPTFLCTVGWDWIPPIRDRDMGLWQKVSLLSSGPVIIQDPVVTSDLPLPKTDSADLTLETTLRNVTDTPQIGTLAGAFGNVHFEIPITLAPNESKLLKLTPKTLPPLHINNPRLWWPNTYGSPELYTLNLDFNIAGNTSDSRTLNFGIRKITYHVPTTENLTLSVNGVPIICKGGNWGMDEAMKRIPRERLEAQVRLHQLANYTMIRNWVGQSTSEDFYDLCDRYGILVWDEFFQPNPSDGSNPLDAVMYLANVREKVLRFRSHPSIALWCARNEGNPPPVIDTGIQKIMAELDTIRLYQKNSNDGRGVHSGGPYAWRTPIQFYSAQRNAPLEPFKTELGSVSIPTLEAIQAMLPEKDWNTFNDDWASHDLCRGAQQGDQYPLILARRYGTLAAGTNQLPDFVRKAQLANYEAFRAMYEGRFAKLFNPCTGILTWMSNPAQPSFVWQLYSHDLEPNASLFAVRKACEPLHIQMNQNNFHIVVVNATAREATGLAARLRIFNLDGTLKSEKEFPVSAAASVATEVADITWPADLSPVHFIKLELRNAQGQILSDNFYWRANPAAPDDFTPLQSMPSAALKLTSMRHDEPETTTTPAKCLVEVTLSNPGNTIALMAHLQLRKQSTGSRILPVYYSDNYVSLLPGESKIIKIEAAASDVAGDTPIITLDGWNIPPQ